jgi:hypothetical protein
MPDAADASELIASSSGQAASGEGEDLHGDTADDDTADDDTEGGAAVPPDA